MISATPFLNMGSWRYIMNNMSRRVLLVEDEEKITNVVESFLESKDYIVITADNGRKALEIFEKENVSIVLLDLMLPELSGEEVCRVIRMKSRVPIIMLTAKHEEHDLLNGLGLGADDYITKPFSLKTLYARMEAVLRRFQDETFIGYLKYTFFEGDLIVDTNNHIVLKQSKEIKVTPNEYKILTCLITHSNKAFSREELIIAAFGVGFEGYDRTIDSHIKNLRQKIETDPRNPVYVKTVHGLGYKFGIE